MVESDGITFGGLPFVKPRIVFVLGPWGLACLCNGGRLVSCPGPPAKPCGIGGPKVVSLLPMSFLRARINLKSDFRRVALLGNALGSMEATTLTALVFSTLVLPCLLPEAVARIFLVVRT